jgi:hypothetical protein
MIFVKMCIKLSSEDEDQGDGLSAAPSAPMNVVFAEGVFSFAFVCQNCAFFYYNTLHKVRLLPYLHIVFLLSLSDSMLTKYRSNVIFKYFVCSRARKNERQKLPILLSVEVH